MIAAAVLTSLIALSPLPPDQSWTAVLSPPYERANVEALRYRPDPAGIDVKRRPWQTAAAGGGDCEDLAIAEYHRLRLSGVPADRLFILVGYLNPGGWHAVVALAGEDGWEYIDPTQRLARSNMRPLFLVNEDGSYLVGVAG